MDIKDKLNNALEEMQIKSEELLALSNEYIKIDVVNGRILFDKSKEIQSDLKKMSKQLID